MNVYIVLETYPEYDLVDNDLNVLGFDVGIIKGVYGTYQAAIRNAKVLCHIYVLIVTLIWKQTIA